MTPKTLAALLGAAVAAGTVAAVELARDECVDSIVVTKTSDGYTKSLVRICEGDAPLPDGSEVVWASAEKTTKPLLEAPIKTPTVEQVVGGCACGPTKASDCTVTDSDGKRPSRPGEHLFGGTWSGGCIPKACVEVSAVEALGAAKPAACGGKNFGEKASTAAPAVEAKPVEEVVEVAKE